MSSVIVKLNEGVSGAGNAVVNLAGLPGVSESGYRDEVTKRVYSMQLESPDLSLQAYLDKFAEGAGIVEERIVGEEIRSPSVQLLVTPPGAVELLSTHDQLLGGAGGQSYPAVVPRRPGARAISAHASPSASARWGALWVVLPWTSSSATATAAGRPTRSAQPPKGGTTHPF
jgi:hypothetical protein